MMVNIKDISMKEKRPTSRPFYAPEQKLAGNMETKACALKYMLHFFCI